MRKRCSDCRTWPKRDVYQSAAGWYIGYACDCGPHSRESIYYPTKKIAEDALKLGNYILKN